MAKEIKSSSESKLRGSLVDHAAKKTGSLAVSKLRGSLVAYHARKAAEAAEEPKLVPEGYNLPDAAAEAIARREANENLAPFLDPEGIIVPGTLLTNPVDPDHRRLIASVYTTPRGSIVAAVHIEGEGVLRNVPFADLQQRMHEGRLIPPT